MFPVTSEQINMAASTRLGPKLSLLVHLLIFSWYVFTIWSNCTLQTSDRHPGVRSYGGRWKYLTFINLVTVRRCQCSESGRARVSHVCVFLSAGVAYGVFWSVCAGGRGSQRGVRQTEPRRDSSDPR